MGAWFFKKSRLFRGLVVFVMVWFLIISTPFVPNLILNSLEDQYAPVYERELADQKARYHIIVLGGGHGFDSRLPANSLLSQKALGRLNEAIRLHRQLPNSKLVLSGFSSTEGQTTQAEMLQETALLLGVEREAILLQKEPGNTFEEAKMYSEGYGSASENKPQHPVILVTNASHMSRAVMTFREFGFDPIPSPTNFRLKGSWKHRWVGLPAIENIENLKVGVYEYVGIAWYNLLLSDIAI
ncbi:YdcF family protein [Fodinibius roseus]|nr:YdcF family protein [Fodinibius roseus]